MTFNMFKLDGYAVDCLWYNHSNRMVMQWTVSGITIQPRMVMPLNVFDIAIQLTCLCR